MIACRQFVYVCFQSRWRTEVISPFAPVDEVQRQTVLVQLHQLSQQWVSSMHDCALLHARLYSIDDVEMDDFIPFNPDAAKTLDKLCGDGGSITVGIGDGGLILVVVDEAMGTAADTLQPDVRLHDEVVPE
eukprot:scaffold100460_cov77-Attheya_sp.AAC.1